MSLPDIQNQRGNFGYPLDAGVTDIRRPIQLLVKDSDETVGTVAQISLTVSLPHDRRGVNMSRLPLAINAVDWHKYVGEALSELLLLTIRKTKAPSAEAAIGFPYFVVQKSPITDHEGVLSVDCVIDGKRHQDNLSEPYPLELMVTTPVMTLCPCSKAISKNGAHNQRARVQIRVSYLSDELVWIEDLIQIAEKAASSGVYPIIKREDEKWITEHAYENPKFVEDVARNAAMYVDQIESVLSYEIQVISEESIHDHSAIAVVQG